MEVNLNKCRKWKYTETKKSLINDVDERFTHIKILSGSIFA